MAYLIGEPYKQRIDRALGVVEGQPLQGGVTTIPTRFETLPQPSPQPFKYFRLLSSMQPCGTAIAREVRPVCCGQNDLRMDLVDFDTQKPSVVLYDHLGSARTFNLGEGNPRNQIVPQGTYGLARWVSFTNDDSAGECGERGVWELVGFLPCAAAACGEPSSSSSSESSSIASSSSDSSSSIPSSSSSWSSSSVCYPDKYFCYGVAGCKQPAPGEGEPCNWYQGFEPISGPYDTLEECEGACGSSSGDSGSSSWRSSASSQSSSCTPCQGNQVQVVTDVSCNGGSLTVTKETIEANRCC